MEFALTKEEYSRFSRVGISTGYRHILFFLMLMIGVSLLALREHFFLFVVSLTYALHYCLNISHECWHSMLFRSKKMNNVFGHVLSIFIGVPYRYAKEIHFHHHRYLNQEGDPGFVYSDSKIRNKELCLKVLGILVGFNHMKNVGVVVRSLRSSAKNSSRKVSKPGQVRVHFMDVLTIILFHALLLGASFFTKHMMAFVLYEYAVLALLPFVDTLRGLIEHRKGDGEDSEGYTRNFVSKKIDKWIVKPYFDWHWLHHLYPQIPQSHLSKVEQVLLNRYPKYPYYNSLAKNSVVALMEAFSKRPLRLRRQ